MGRVDQETEETTRKEHVLNCLLDFIEANGRGPRLKELGQSFQLPQSKSWTVMPQGKDFQNIFNTRTVLDGYLEAFRAINVTAPDEVHSEAKIGKPHLTVSIEPEASAPEPPKEAPPRIRTPPIVVRPPVRKPPPKPVVPADGPVVPLSPKPGWGDLPK